MSVDPVTANPNTGANFNRYAYVSNNPYRFTDPDGRYKCAGSKSDCALVADAYKKTEAAAKNLPGGSKEQKALNKVLGFLGKPGQRNGVTIQIGSKGSIPGSLGGTKTSGGKTQIGIPMNEIAKGAGGRDTPKFQDRLAGVVTHEGDHGVTQSENGMPSTRAEAKAGETSAYRTEAALYQGLNSEFSGRALWTPSGGLNEQNIENSAELSTDMWCKASSSAGGC